MQRNANFWILMAVFQVLFGLAVFGLTRDYYLGRNESRPAMPHVPTGGMPADGWPKLTDAGSIDRLTGAAAAPPDLSSPQAIADQADVYFANGQYEQAAELYAKLLTFGPASADTHNNLGLTLQYLGRPDEALKVLHDGIALDPDHQRIWLTLGFVNARLGNIDEARTALTRATEVGSDPGIREAASGMLAELP